MRRLIALTALTTLLLAACGDDSDTSTPAESTTSASETTTTTTTTTTTEAPADDPADSGPADDTSTPVDEPADAADGPIAVGLAEFTITLDGDITAGPNSFTVTNEGEFPHEFGIVSGTSYEDLPTTDNGAIDEEALGDAVLGKTETLDAGGSVEIDFDLAPGDYVLFCNVNFGPNSHAANGQTMSISVG